jgi:plasmid stabilization system protein ParE
MNLILSGPAQAELEKYYNHIRGFNPAAAEEWYGKIIVRYEALTLECEQTIIGASPGIVDGASRIRLVPHRDMLNHITGLCYREKRSWNESSSLYEDAAFKFHARPNRELNQPN